MSTTKGMNIFYNIMTSGKTFDSRDVSLMDMRVRYILLNSMIFLGGTLLFLFGYQSLRVGAPLLGVFDISMGFITLLGFVLLRTRFPFAISGFLTVVSFMFLCAYLAQSGGVQGSGVLWAYSFPLLSIFLLGMGMGTLLSGLLGSFIAIVVLVPGFSAVEFQRSFALRTVGVYILVLVCTLVYEKTKIEKDRHLAILNRTLEAERNEVVTMKDNLKDGIFLMDAAFSIQPSYAPVLSSILAIQEPGGKNFLELLQNSLKEKELSTLKDYFNMVHQRSYDMAMLEEINPLQELTYYSVETGEKRILSCAFAPVDRQDGVVLILGTVKDLTREAELAQQLSEEEDKRQKEMRSLFEVIHVDPNVLSDFIEDTEYEFERINELLKDTQKSSASVMIEIYQSVHAIKSNAVILGLENFSAKLHGLERKIAQLRDQKDVSFEEVLHITVELNVILEEKDSFKDLLKKIQSFKSDEGQVQEGYVLLKTLEKVVEKSTNTLGKKAKLSVKKIDPRVFDGCSRRLIKDVLVQLVRNAVAHGIESPDVRQEKGKNEMGTITLLLEVADGNGVIQLTDDGAGLNFIQIREKAQSMGLIPPNYPVDDKNSLLKVLFSPGFSTAAQADLTAGRGMGLSLVLDRINEEGGSIKISTEEGRGTRFAIAIPLREVPSMGTSAPVAS
jgi:two-component system chemotaxis sensor kinase CheA